MPVPVPPVPVPPVVPEEEEEEEPTATSFELSQPASVVRIGSGGGWCGGGCDW
jgi:hypothetical protein